MELLPDGWIDLEPVLLDRSEGRVVLDCIVARVCLGPDGPGPGADDDPWWSPGTPVGIVVTGRDDAARRATDLERRLLAGATATPLIDRSGPVVLVERGGDEPALDVDPVGWAPGRAAD